MSSNFADYLPAGCIFVLKPQTPEEVAMTENRQMHNVDFRTEPEKLFGIITTTENKEMVQSWMTENGYDANLVCTYGEFEKVFEQEMQRIHEEKFRQTSATFYGENIGGGNGLLNNTEPVSFNTSHDENSIAI